MKWLLISMSLVFAFLGAFTGLFYWAVSYFGGEELAQNLWSPYALPLVYIVIMIMLIAIMGVALQVKGKSRGRQTVGRG